MENKCSLEPQNVNDKVWYYEFPTCIEVHVQVNGVTVILIPRRKLEASLKRMNASRRKKN